MRWRGLIVETQAVTHPGLRYPARPHELREASRAAGGDGQPLEQTDARTHVLGLNRTLRRIWTVQRNSRDSEPTFRIIYVSVFMCNLL